MVKIEELKKQRAALLAQLIAIDDELRSQIPQIKPGRFMCCCGLAFSSYFRLDSHVTTLQSPDHKGMGEERLYIKCPDCKKQFVDQPSYDSHKAACQKIYGQHITSTKSTYTDSKGKERTKTKNTIIDLDQL